MRRLSPILRRRSSLIVTIDVEEPTTDPHTARAPPALATARGPRGRVRAWRGDPAPPASVRAAALRVERRDDGDHRARHLGGAARARGLGARARRALDPDDRPSLDAHDLP